MFFKMRKECYMDTVLTNKVAVFQFFMVSLSELNRCRIKSTLQLVHFNTAMFTVQQRLHYAHFLCCVILC